MASQFWDKELETLAARYERFEFDFPALTLAGKVILAPGGAGGLGAATVALLVAEGVQVVVGYRQDRSRAEKLAQTLNSRGPGRVHLVEGDLRQPEARRQLVERGTGLGDIYGLVNFLGDPARADFATLDDRTMADSLATNYIAPVLLARDVAAHMIEHKVAGSLVFLASMQAVAEFEGSVNYAGAKAALVHAARILARQWGSLRVNVVAPGVTIAGMARASLESGKYDAYRSKGIIPRFGRPEDVARVIRLLLEPDNYLTGQVITVDGGLSLRR
ncbi:MAG TPA: SDR family oxidoreductase [Candidatus Xenobia bacterium]|nr:SDR family oxidoreductase [Candidatus Xenobia bacterium]